MSAVPRSAGTAVSPDACSHLTGHDHVASLAAALRDVTGHVATLDRWGRLLAGVLRGEGRGRLLAAGNGGSAAQAQHLTAELVGRYRAERPPFSAICLSAETSSLTAIANDYPAEELFARQVEAHGRAGDVLVLLSTSGRSPNAVAAARRARECGLTVLALTGPGPNSLADVADEAVCIDSAWTATVQECHLVALHLLCAAFDAAVLAEPARVPAGAGDAPGREAGNGPRERPAPASEAGGARPLVVVGDALLDVDLVGTASRLTPDAPVPVVEDVERRERPGGAALAAVIAAASTSRPVVLVTPMADDDGATRLRALLAGRVRLVEIPATGGTAVKRRVRVGDHSVVRIDSGDPVVRLGALPDEAREVLRTAAAVLVADYGRGTTASAAVREALAAAGGPIVWDPHPRGADPVPSTRLVTPNGAEAARVAAAAGVPADGDGLAAVGARAEALIRRWGVGAVSVTLGARGALLSYGGGAPMVVPAHAVTGGDPCGAGDAFAAAAALLLADGAVTGEAVAGAVAAASVFVGRGGAGAWDAGDAPRSGARAPNVIAEPGVDSVLSRVRAAGGTVVATGGCFDLLHPGHVATLRAARGLGDCLVVCINSDDSVRRLKGPARPLVSAADRARVLDALEFVDAVVVFEEDTPAAVLDRLRPDVWAKGGDYAGADLPEAAVLRRWGGQAVVLPYLDGHSTTALVERSRA
ncbi:D-glycero-beta-D-manno-heptose 1-phosphate adenylyltransferase [Trujillonella endophytica]|uniref:D-glycero-beta-D-manno-heptose 1-phosphate adenylyltransferase n=1 Tax=Trujillonella endophytica TaxID=673521 RepID=A0A1H8W1X4_9ACTN|nr:D-glycero-beta-D-manno-heptose 1-phosphate adenylyltransferase [Trujillella endophytica]SEP21639.1 rfaE bifunctional protein, domain I/rfaE bifunctional protein, domain II [Trujillella endophytica]